MKSKSGSLTMAPFYPPNIISSPFSMRNVHCAGLLLGSCLLMMVATVSEECGDEQVPTQSSHSD